MTVETYRYLFSALIQVFGAIIAVGGVFMVWKYDLVQRRLEQLTKRLGVLTYFFENSISSDTERMTYGDAMLRGEEFLSFKPSTVIEIVDGIMPYIKEHSTKVRLELHINKFKYDQKFKESFPRSIWEIMGIPALLVTIFSVELFYAECVFHNSCEKYISIFSILLSVIGFYRIISISSKSFQENRI